MSNSPEVIERLVLDGDDHNTTFVLYEKSLKIHREASESPQSCHRIPNTNLFPGNGPNIELETDIHNVLFAHLDDRKLSVSFLVKKKNKRAHLTLLHVGGPVKHNEREDTADFVRALMKAAYRGMLSKPFMSSRFAVTLSVRCQAQAKPTPSGKPS